MPRRRLRRLLGLSEEEARALRGGAVAKLGRRGYLLRAIAFNLATAPLLRRAIPAALRERAIRPLLYVTLPDPSANLVYVEAAGGER